jgi:hypothetical protein
MGNFPQAFSHVALVNTAYNFTCSEGPAEVHAGREAADEGAGYTLSSAQGRVTGHI